MYTYIENTKRKELIKFNLLFFLKHNSWVTMAKPNTNPKQIIHDDKNKEVHCAPTKIQRDIICSWKTKTTSTIKCIDNNDMCLKLKKIDF